MHNTTKGSNDTHLVGFSRSLDLFCEKLENDDGLDMVGLVAYSLYKQSQSEWAAEHKPTEQEVKDYFNTLTPHMRKIFRLRAEDLLYKYSESVYEISYETAFKDAFQAIYAEVIETVSNKLDKNNAEQKEKIIDLKNTFEINLKKLAKWKSFLFDIGTNVIGSTVTLFLGYLFLFAILGSASFKDVISKISEPSQATQPIQKK